jgi:hypothetical protein
MAGAGGYCVAWPAQPATAHVHTLALALSMSGIRWFDNTTVADAIALAAAEDRPLLVDFWSPTCLGCAKLFAVTYPDPRVERALGEAFVCIKYDTKAPNEWFRRLNGSFGHHWHPNVVVMDHRLVEGRRFIGYLPPEEFVAQVEVGRALVALHHQRARDARAILGAVLARFPHAHVAPEAMYWEGVAAYRVGGRLPALTDVWRELAGRYPTSEWTVRADCLDVVIPATGFRMSDPASVRLVAAPAA